MVINLKNKFRYIDKIHYYLFNYFILSISSCGRLVSGWFVDVGVVDSDEIALRDDAVLFLREGKSTLIDKQKLIIHIKSRIRAVISDKGNNYGRVLAG